MPSSRRLAPLILVLASPLLAASCGRDRAPQPGSSAAGPAAASPAVSGVGVIAEVNGAPILQSELDQRAASRLARVRQEEYEIRRQTLDEMVAERLIDAEAARRGVSREVLLEKEVSARAEAPSPATILALYEVNKDRFGAMPKEQALGQIRASLGQRALAERRSAFEKQLRQGARVAVRLEPPRSTVKVPDGTPATGPASVPVSIVEFTDYQCPYCHRAQSVIDEVLARYPGKVRLVHMDFPLDGHSGAFPAARAARCAGEQGRFWEFHRDLMTVQGPLDDADLEKRAGRLGLKAPEFTSCLASQRHDAAIRASLEEGETLGVNGTPAYFVNGRMLSGVRPVEGFAEVIDSELARR